MNTAPWVGDMTMRYIAIDLHSGYIWGDVEAESPTDACRAIDQDVAPGLVRKYEEHSPSTHISADNGYRVYEAASNTPPVTDGQNRDQIDMVEALPAAALVTYTQEPTTGSIFNSRTA